MTTEKKIHAYVDADLIQYRFSIANQNKDGTVDFERAKDQVASYIQKIEDRTRADKMTMVFSDRKNFRKVLNRCYKANRNATEKPILFNQVREFMRENWHSISVPYLEADDVLGIMCTSRADPDEIPVLVSYDKDMKTLPVTLYNPQTDEFEKVESTDAERTFWTQCVTGDTTDGYYGIPGVGPKGAVAIVDEIMSQPDQESKLGVLLREYAWRYLDRDYALRQCRMAYILRGGDYDVMNNAIRLFGSDEIFVPELEEKPKDF